MKCIKKFGMQLKLSRKSTDELFGSLNVDNHIYAIRCMRILICRINAPNGICLPKCFGDVGLALYMMA